MKACSEEFEAAVARVERVDGVPSVVYGTLKDTVLGKEIVWSAESAPRSKSRKWHLHKNYGADQNRLIRRLLSKVAREYTERVI